MYIGTYNVYLVVISVLVAIMASYTALDLAGRITSAQGKAARWWLAGGAFAMGMGIWSMHFIGMLAFSLPVPLGYDPLITFASLLIAIASSAFALWLVSQPDLPWPRLGLGALLMGIGVAAMHYSGMAAMQMTPGIIYRPTLFILSIFIAVAASGAALWIAFHLRRQVRRVRSFRAVAAVVMGIAISGMHYTGMAAAEFPFGSMCGAARSGVSPQWLSLVIIVTTAAVLAIALIVSLLDARMESRTSILANSLAAANNELTHLALHDNLTGLPNRLLLEDRLEQAVRAANREGSHFAVLFIDLDGFKAINDVFGHHAGDLLLVEVAKRIRNTVREKETVARVGGDEFVLLVDVDDPEDSATLADKLIAALQQPFVIAGQEVGISASIGIAIYPGNGTNRHELVTNADAAMYHAKNLGRARYCFFEDSMNTNVQDQLKLLSDLRLALERRELVLHFQPKFRAPDRHVIGAEALLRWAHPTRGLIAPGAFIPLAEKTGLIVSIGEWVLNEACRQMSIWHKAGHTDWTMAVNLSALQFNHPSLVPMVRKALEHHALEPRYLTLEVTESTAMHDADASLAILQQLHDMGVCISIDDFGTGYSSLLYLKRLPATELKIDRGFIRELSRDTEDGAIVTAIIALGQALDLKIVAEGVETVAQQEFLAHLGCDTLQGFLLAHPMSADEFMNAVTQKTELVQTS